MKKPLLVFAASIGTSLILYLVAVLQGHFYTVWETTFNYWAVLLQPLLTFIISIPVAFVCFYTLARKEKIEVRKINILFLIVGILVGNIVFLWSVNFSRNLAYLNMDVYYYVNYLSANFVLLFFSAIAAFSLAELKEKRQATTCV